MRPSLLFAASASRPSGQRNRAEQNSCTFFESFAHLEGETSESGAMRLGDGDDHYYQRWRRPPSETVCCFLTGIKKTRHELPWRKRSSSNGGVEEPTVNLKSLSNRRQQSLGPECCCFALKVRRGRKNRSGTKTVYLPNMTRDGCSQRAPTSFILTLQPTSLLCTRLQTRD